MFAQLIKNSRFPAALPLLGAVVFFLLTLLVITVHPTPLAPSFFLTALVGLFALSIFRKKGLLLASAATFALLLLYFPYLWREKGLWEVGFGYALINCFYLISTALDALEAELQRLKDEAQPRKIDKVEETPNHLYTQLKGQFEEKRRLLDATRQELFQTQGQLLALQKQMQEAGEEETYAATLAKLTHENLQYQEEIKLLEGLISRYIQ